MAGIKETKELLRKEILELHKNLSAVKPEWLFSREENKSQWQEYAGLAASLAKKIETLAFLNALEEEKPAIVPPLPEVKAQENFVPGISFSEKITPVTEVKQPEPIPVVEKNIPLIPEIKEAEVNPVTEVKQPEPIPVVEKNIPEIKKPGVNLVNENNPPAPEIKTPEKIPTVQPTAKTFPDLKSFIGFNEKLMFQRSLFKAAGSDYENAIAQLNSCTSYKEAEAVLNNLATANKWSAEDEPAQVFYSIVKRRFA
jgi:hypothetical protein